MTTILSLLCGIFFVLLFFVGPIILLMKLTKRNKYNSRNYYSNIFLPIFNNKIPNGIIVWDYFHGFDRIKNQEVVEVFGNIQQIRLDEIAKKFYKANVLKKDFDSIYRCYINSNNPNRLFEYMEVEETHNSDGTTIVSLNGKLYHIVSPFNIQGRIRIITSKTWDFAIGKSIENVNYGFVEKKEDEQMIEVSDIQFNKMYQVFTNNPHMAHYILNPTIIEKLKNYRQVGDFSITLENNDIYVAKSIQKINYPKFNSYKNSLKPSIKMFNEIKDSHIFNEYANVTLDSIFQDLSFFYELLK